MMYAIMTPHGFQMRGSEAAVYSRAKDAHKHMTPGDSLVPIEERSNGHKLRHHAIILPFKR